MKRRGFLALLGLAPAAPLVAKELLEEKPDVPEWFGALPEGVWAKPDPANSILLDENAVFVLRWEGDPLKSDWYWERLDR